jgi:hypothetical protein
MTSLILELQREHQLIAEHLKVARDAGVDSQKGLLALGKAKATLLAHLKKEDEQLYPLLREAAKKDRRLAWLLELYARDMEEVSTAALAFFDKYANGGRGVEFGRDFGTLIARLNARIANEERELYREFDAITGKGREAANPVLFGTAAVNRR